MIDVRNLVVDFGSGPILDGIEFSVKEGETAVVMGKNGCGKSVLLKTIIGLIQPTSGDVLISGISVGKVIKHERPPVEVGYVFQKGGLFDSMTVFDNVAFPLRRKRIPESDIEKRVREVLAMVGLEGNEYKFPSELSGGMQKRVGLARAICKNPQVVLYDDPTAGLDPILTDSICELMISLRESYRITSVVVTHDLKVAEKIANNIFLIYRGKLVFSDSADAFFSYTSEYARQFCEGEIEGPIDIY
ncbi:MAG: ATP-binding cassette domain-containing protein [Spirochaetes bacterium]|nr:ATP-binding cassette domain-containing protein [Spirochaetota bacterium]